MDRTTGISYLSVESMAKKKQQRSAVLQLLDLVYAVSNKGTSHSYERLNHAMRNALELAVGAGFEFDEGDVAYILGPNYRSSYWVGSSDEWIYSQAIAVGNSSAIASYELAKKRQAIIADDVDLHCDRNHYLHMSGTRQRERICVGATFTYRGQTLTVTSFASDSSYANACSYVNRKVSKRFKITRDDIIADRSERKERNKILALLKDVGDKEGTTAEIVKALGVKTTQDYAKLDIEKIRNVASKFIVKT